MSWLFAARPNTPTHTDVHGSQRGDAAAVARVLQTTAVLESKVAELTQIVQQQASTSPSPSRDVIITMVGHLGLGVASRFVRSLRETGAQCDVVLMIPQQECPLLWLSLHIVKLPAC